MPQENENKTEDITETVQSYAEVTDDNRIDAYLHFLRITKSELFTSLVDCQPFPEAVRDASRHRFATMVAAERENGVDTLAGTTTRVCKRFEVIYDKHYINLCLPFIIAGFSERDCFLVSCAFIKRYGGFTFAKSVDSSCLIQAEGESEKHNKTFRCLERLASLLLLYNYPELYAHFNSIQTSISEVIQPWFENLFLTVLPFESIIPFMDFYLKRAEMSFFMFFCIALIAEHREQLLKLQSKEETMKYLSSLIVETNELLNSLLEKASNIAGNTPSSFRKQVLACLTDSQHFKLWVYSYSQSAPCLHVSVMDVLSDIEKRNMKYMIIDCRPREEFVTQGSLQTAYHVDPSRFSTPAGLAAVVNEIVEISQGCSQRGITLHVVICGIGRHDVNEPGAIERTMLVSALAQKQIKYLSILRNGFQSVISFLTILLSQVATNTFYNAHSNFKIITKPNARFVLAIKYNLPTNEMTYPLDVVKSTGSTLLGALHSGWLSLKKTISEEQQQSSAQTYQQGSGAFSIVPDKKKENLELVVDVKVLTKELPFPEHSTIFNPNNGCDEDMHVPEPSSANIIEDADMFAIDDDEEADGENEISNDTAASSTNSTPANTKEAQVPSESSNGKLEKNENAESPSSQFTTWMPTPLSSWIDEGVPIFQCYAVHASGEEKRFLAFLPTELVCLRLDSSNTELCIPTCRHPYEGIATLTFNKRAAQDIIVTFKDRDGTETTEQFHAEGNKELLKMFRKYITAFSEKYKKQERTRT